MSTQASTLDQLAPIPLRPMKKQRRRLTGEESVTGKQITKLQLLFCDFYEEGNSPYKAALLAGYTESTARVASTVILRSEHVVKELAARGEDYFKKLNVNVPLLLQEATKIALHNPMDYIDVQDDGTFKVNLKYINRDMGVAIKEISYDPEGRPKIVFADKQRAIEFITKVYGGGKLGGDSDEDNSPVTIQSLDAIVRNETNYITVNQQVLVQHNQQAEQRKQLDGIVESAG